LKREVRDHNYKIGNPFSLLAGLLSNEEVQFLSFKIEKLDFYRELLVLP
jgi:hypothetical protein